MNIERRKFGAAVGGFVVTLVVGCGGNNNEEEGSFSISANHPGEEHSIAISAADVASAQAAGQKGFDIRGLARHSHIVVFTFAELQQLQQGLRISKQSEFASDGSLIHSHQVTVFRLSE